MKIGISSFAFTSPFCDAEIGLIKKVADMGFDVFEMAMEDPELIHPEIIKASLEENHIGITTCAVIGEGRDLSSDSSQIRASTKMYLRECILLASKVGSNVVAGALYSTVGKRRFISPQEKKAEWKRSVESLKEVSAYAGDHGVKLAIEPLNRFENDMINTSAQGVEMIEDVGSPHLGLLLDTFHMNIEEKNTKGAILIGGKHVFHMHVCENDRGIPGTGQVDWKGTAKALKEIDYQGACVIEAFTPALTSLAAAVCLWRPLAPSQEVLGRDGLAFLRDLLN